jgi:hypothetical protein
VHQVDPGVPGQARKVLLLAAHPLGAAGRPHGDDDRLEQLAERIAGGLAIHERGEARVRRSGGEQRRQQLARRDLHSPGLAGHQEDQVQADVGQRAGFSSARHTDVHGAP